MASPVKREPPDAENDQLFGMNDPSPFLHGDMERREEFVDPWLNVKLEDNDPFGVEALLNAPVDDYKMEEEDEYDMRLNGDLALDHSNYLALMDDGEEMRERNEAQANFTDPLGANLSMTDKDSAQDSHVNWVNPRLPRGNFVPPGCTLFGIGAAPPQTEPTPNNEPPIDNVIEKEPPANLYDAIKKKTRRQSAKVIEEKENTVVEKRGRKSTVAKKVAGARRSIPRNAKKTVEPGQDVAVPKGRRGRPKGSKTKPANPPVLSPMDNENASMVNGIMDSALVRRRPRMVGGTGNAAAAETAEHASDPLSSLHPWNGSVQASHPFHHSFDNSPIDRSHSTTVSHSYTGGRTTVSQWGVHSTTVSRSASNINPIADHNYSVSVSKKRAADARMAKRGGVAPVRQRQTAMVRLAPPKPPHCPPPIDIPNGGGVMVVDPRMERRETEGEEEMGRAREQQQMDTAMAFYDPRRVQRKSIQGDFVPHPLDEGEMFRVVCGPIPEKEVSLDVIRERVLSLCRPFDFKFTRFEGSYYMWLRFTVEQETFDLFRSKPIRLGLFSTAFYKPGTLTVDTNGPMGDYYLLIILSKYGTVAGVEKIGEFKWKATYLEDTEAMTVVNLKGETVGQASLAYSPYIPPTHPTEMESPASPPYESEDVADPSTSMNVPAQPALPILPVHRSSPIHIPTDKEDPYVYDQLLPAGTDAQSYHAAQTPATGYGDYPTGGAMVVPYVRPMLAPAAGRTKGQHYTGALVPRAAGTMAAQPPHSGGYRVQPYEGHMAHLVPAAAAAPGGGGVRLPTTAQRGGMVMVRSTIENAVERMRRRGEGLAAFPLIDADDVKECVVGMRAWTNNIVLGPMPSVYDEDEMRRVYQIHHEIGLRMIGDFMHLFIAADASHEAKLHLWRIQNENCTGGVMTNIAKGIPRSIIVEATSIYSTAQTVSDYFERQFGRVVSVNEQHERSAKIFAVNFMHRKEAASAFNTRIHFAYVNGEAFVLCEVVKD